MLIPGVIDDRVGIAPMLGQAPAMRALHELIGRLAATRAPVLVRGESGTGKALVARALHAAGPSRTGPFVAVSCTALAEELLDAEIFGARQRAKGPPGGLVTAAEGGTLFLDELGDLPLPLQAKLVRVLDEGPELRLIAATHQDLEHRTAGGLFRADLYHRVTAMTLRVPALRERLEDVALLSAHFLERARRRHDGARLTGLAPELMRVLVGYSWPGNVRELEHLIERLVLVLDQAEAELEDVRRLAPELLREPSPLEGAKRRVLSLRDLQDEYIEWAIAYCGGNKSRAAQLLGIDKSTIFRRERDRGR
jgi:two-component system response regulator HydG